MSVATLESAGLNRSQTVKLFKVHRAAAGQAETHATSQTTRLPTLDAAIVSLLLATPAWQAFVVVEVLSCGVEVLLCGVLVYQLHGPGGHIGHDWVTSNQIAAGCAALVPFVGEQNARRAQSLGNRLAFPRFRRRPQCLAGPFAIALIG